MFDAVNTPLPGPATIAKKGSTGMTNSGIGLGAANEKDIGAWRAQKSADQDCRVSKAQRDQAC